MKRSIQGKSYDYLTPDEARCQGMGFVEDWRTAETGDWALLDDGCIAPVLSAKETSVQEHGRRVKVVRFPHGTFFGRRSQRATSGERACVYSATGKRTDFSDPDRPLSAKERRFVMLYLADFDVLAAFRQATDSDPALKTFRARAAAYFRRANIRVEIEARLREQLKGTGIDEQWWGEQLRHVVEQADCPRDRLAGLELVARALGLLNPRAGDTVAAGLPVGLEELERLREERKSAR